MLTVKIASVRFVGQRTFFGGGGQLTPRSPWLDVWYKTTCELVTWEHIEAVQGFDHQ